MSCGKRGYLFLMLGIVLTALVACGGSGGGGETGGGGGGPSTAVAVLFPAPDAITLESQVRVRGTTTLGAESLEVGSVAATSDDGFLSWHVDLNLQEGMNDLEIRVTEAGMSFPAGSHSLRFEPRFDIAANSFALGQDGSAVYLSRSATGDYGLTRIQVDGSRQTFQNLSVPTAPGANGMAYDSQRQRLTYLESLNSIAVFDLANDAMLGSFNPPSAQSFPTTMALDPNSGEVFVNVLEINPLPGVEYIYRFDPVAGSFSVVAGPVLPSLGNNLRFLTYDAINNYLYGWYEDMKHVLRYDPSSGAHIVFVSGLASLGNLTGMAVNPVQGRLEVVNSAGRRFGLSTVASPPVLLPRVAEDPVFANDPPMTAPQLPAYQGIQGDGRGGLLLLRSDRAVHIDDQGNSSLLYRHGRGDEISLNLGAFYQLTWDTNRERIIGNGSIELFGLDPMTGHAIPLASPPSGFVAPLGKRIYFDGDADRIYYIGATGSPPAPGIYVTPATGGDALLEAPLPPGFVTTDIDYDPATDEFLAVTVTFFGPPTSIVVSRIATSGATVATFQITNSPVLGTEFLADAVNRTIFGLRQNQMDIVRLALPNFALTSIAPFAPVFNVPYAMIHDRERNELVRYSEGNLTITDIATGQETASAVLPGRYAALFNLRGLTRDPKSGIIYIGGPNGRMLAVEPTTFTTTIIHY